MENSSRRRQVFVRKHRKATSASKNGTASSSERSLKKIVVEATNSRKVVVARKVHSDDTVASFKQSKQSIKMREPYSPMETLTETLHKLPNNGPQYDMYGNLVERSVLGSSLDFVQLKRSHNTRLPLKGVSSPRTMRKATKAGTSRERISTAWKSVRKFAERLSEAREGKIIEDREFEQTLDELLLEDRIIETREERALYRWKVANAEWDRIKNQISRKIGKDPDKLIMSTAEDYRETVEELDTLRRSLPFEQHGEQYWYQSLRTEGEFYVQVGNVFSGLFCKVKEPAPIAEIIRKPRAPPKIQTDSKKIPYISKKSSITDGWKGYQGETRKKLIKKIETVNPNSHIDCRGLEIVGVDLFCLRVSVPSYSFERQMEESRMETADASPFSFFKKKRKIVSAATGKSNEKPIVPRAVNNVKGPSLILSSSNVTVFTSVDQRCFAEVTVNNNGTCALQFEWSFMSNKIEKVESNRLFSCRQDNSKILPGDQQSTMFFFSSSLPGTFLEEVSLLTVPALSNGSPKVLLKGVCVSRDDKTLDRHDLERKIIKNQIQHEMRELIESIVRDQVKIPDPPETELPRIFYLQNLEWKLYYYKDVFEDLKSLADEVISMFKRAIRRITTWDYSASSLFKWILALESDKPDVASEYKRRFRNLVCRAAVRPEPDSESFKVMQCLLRETVSEMHRFAWHARCKAVEIMEEEKKQLESEEQAEQEKTKPEEENDEDNSDEESEMSDEEEKDRLKERMLFEMEQRKKDGYLQTMHEFVRSSLCKKLEKFVPLCQGDVGSRNSLLGHVDWIESRETFDVQAWGCTCDGAEMLGSLKPYPVSEISCGPSFNVCLTANNQVYTWQANEAVSKPSEKDNEVPTEEAEEAPSDRESDDELLPEDLPKLKCISELNGFILRKVSSGLRSQFVVADGGELFGWNVEQQTIVNFMPTERVIDVSCGSEVDIVLATTDSGRVFSWGDQSVVHLLGRKTAESTTESEEESGGTVAATVPGVVHGLEGSVIVTTTIGKQHCLALSDSGEVFSWGLPGPYLGVQPPGESDSGSKKKATKGGSDQETIPQPPMRVPLAVSVTESETSEDKSAAEETAETEDNTESKSLELTASAIACGSSHSLILTETGRLYSFGVGARGVLGHGDEEDISTPKEVSSLKESHVIEIAAGHSHSVVLTDSGSVYTFGSFDGHALQPLKVSETAELLSENESDGSDDVDDQKVKIQPEVEVEKDHLTPALVDLNEKHVVGIHACGTQTVVMFNNNLL
eukprot:944147_1